MEAVTGIVAPVIAQVLAHEGGWDEILYVSAPIVLIAGLLFAANRKATRRAAELAEADRAQQAGTTATRGDDPDT